MAKVALALPADTRDLSWLPETPRQQAGSTALTAALNSTLHRERWKYTSSKLCLEALNAVMQPPRITGLDQTGVQHLDLAPSALPDALFDPISAPEAAARLSYANQISIVEITAPLQQSLHIYHAANTQPCIILLRTNSEAELLEIIQPSDAPMQQTLWVYLEANARLVHSRNTEPAESTSGHGAALSSATDHNWQYLRILLDQAARYSLHNHLCGASQRRQDIQICLAAPDSEANLLSAAAIGAKQHLDQQVTIEHRAPRTRSQQRLHNVVADGGNITFNGRIHIHAGANGSDAQLSNKNIALGDGATINTKPELEIYTDDVRCAHGATIGQLAADEIYYLQSRGINAEQAQTLLSRGFLLQCMQGPLAESAQKLLNTLGLAQEST